jgi:TolB-like protein/class 3 adenylate cyclase
MSIISQRAERKLAAILAADVVGYTRLMAADEERTLEALTEHRRVIDSIVSKQHGRVFGVVGDSLMAEFASPLEAVRCATEIQSRFENALDATSDEIQMRFRIGVNLGHVIVDGNNLYGQGVNVAARLEALAESGGICVSDEIYRDVESQVSFDFQDIGVQKFKNITEPVHVWQINLDRPIHRPSLKNHAARSVGTSTRYTADKPAIVVLPFENFSGDPDQEYFCDGLTNDIITDLSKFANLFVIAPHSAFVYKGRRVKPKQIGEELGVRYLLEGSVRKTDTRLRINAELVNTDTEYQLWAERFDRDVSDLFAIQDELIQKIVVALAVRVERIERKRVARKDVADLSAYEMYLKGIHIYSNESKERLEQSRRLFEQAVERDPAFARGWGYLSYTYTQTALARWPSDASKADALAKAEIYAKKAVLLDPDDYANHWDLAFAYVNSKRHEQALIEYKEALALNENDADVLVEMAETLIYAGEHQQGIGQVKKAMQINPLHPYWYRWVLGLGYFYENQYLLTVEQINRMYEMHHDCQLLLAAAYAYLGDEQGAKNAMQNFLEYEPNWTIEAELQRMPIKNRDDRENWIAGLRNAGLPD